ncbi:monocarboxylate transporter 14-like isoform X2 [Cherax quadricarinatus]|uniref:monocarboxylate transporter 14-like isoform X2 n=1 Tax=Cherax quadricarinatus TaxID=27406 RepID=UPI00387E61B8
MKLDKQISNDKPADNKEDEVAHGKTDKERKEETNERLAGTSKGASVDSPEENTKNDELQGSDSLTEVSNKLSEDLISKEDKHKEEPEKMEQELENYKELDLSRIDSKMTVNLETIREGEVLEIPPETISPQVHASKAQFYFDDTTSEFESRDDGHHGTQCYYEDDDDNGSITSLPAELPPPPDGGWGWMIVVVSFLCNAIVDGVAYSFSPFLETICEQFDAPKGTVAWIPSLLAGVYLSAGPIVSALTNKFGCRCVCCVGGLLASFAFFLTIFANSVEYLMVLQGIIGGLGFGLIYLPAVVCVGYYFESKRAMATGIAVCGSGIGTMIFPPLLTYFISVFTWKGANLIISAIILNCCCFGALMRPLEVPRMKKKDLLQRLAEEKRAYMEAGSFCGSSYITYTHPDGTVERQPKRAMNADPGVHSHLNLSGYLTPVPTSLALPTIQETQGSTPPDQDSPLAASEKESTPASPTAANHEHLDGGDEKQSLVKGTDGTTVVAPVISPRVPVPSAPIKMPRNCSQPVMAHGASGLIPKNGSVPNFERRYSRVEYASHMKVVPATPKASSTNLRALGSQEMRRMSGGYGRVNSNNSFIDPESGIRQRRSSAKSMMLRPMSRQDIFYSGSIANLREFKSQASMLSYRESALNLQGTGASRVVLDALDEPLDEKESCTCLPESIKGTLSQMMDFSLLKNPIFLLIGVANLFGMLGFYTPFVYLPDAAKEKGIAPEHATFLISLIGITNTIGRIITGCIADLPNVSPLWINNICIILSGVCVFLTPFASSYGSFVALSLFFGLFVSPFIALTSIIIVDLLSLRQLTNAFGLLCIFRGVAGILGPPVSGSIYDATKSYDVSFYCAGVLLFVCAALHCIVPLVQRCYQDDMPVRYTTNEEYLAAVPEEEESDSAGVSPDTGEGVGIVLDIKPKDSTIILQESGENKIRLDATQNEKEKENVSSL